MQRATELEMQRATELEMQRATELEMQRATELEMQRATELEMRSWIRGNMHTAKVARNNPALLGLGCLHFLC